MKRMEKILLARQLDGILVSSSANMRSSVGFRGEGIIFVSRNRPLVFTDSRYTIAAKEECPEADVIQYKKISMRAGSRSCWNVWAGRQW